jgi:hypothetical protein
MSGRRFKRFKNSAEKLTQMLTSRPPRVDSRPAAAGPIRGQRRPAARNPGDSKRLRGIDAK